MRASYIQDLRAAVPLAVILETGFTNLQFVGLASLAHEAGDYLFEKLATSIQTDEARRAQIGHPVSRAGNEVILSCPAPAIGNGWVKNIPRTGTI
jgi:hypothetical protein